MKKRILSVIISMLCVAMLFSACDNFNSFTGTSDKETSYTVTFLNYDNTLLYCATGIKEGEPAIYEGDTPTRPDSNEYTYSFIGWDRDISAIYSNLVVFAKYSETQKTDYSKFNTANKNGKILAYQGTQQNKGLTFANAINIDNQYYFYYFYLGTVSKVPLYTSVALQYQYNSEVTFNFNELTSESLTNSISRSTATVDTHSYTGGFKIGFMQEFSAEAGAVFAKAKASFTSTQETDHHWTNNWGSTLTESETATSSYLTQYSKGYSEKISFSEEAGFTKGNYYRMSFYDTLSAYGVLAYEVATNTYSAANDFFLKDNSTMRIWEESSNGVFEYGQEKEIEFDVNKAIEYVETHKSELALDKGNDRDYVVAENPRFYESTDTFLVADTGYFGLADREHETIDLSKYSEYFSENYLFCFAVTLNISRVDSGYQEIYLYNDYKTTSKEMEISTAVSSYGLVRGSIITHGSGAYDHYISWNVRGDELKDTMYIRYDAQGNNNDDWYKNSILVGLTIVSESKNLPLEQTILDNSNQITVIDDGVFGLAARSFDQMLLSSYAEYMTADYFFLFDVTINMHEKNDGYQEIYLYNKYDVTTSSTNKDISYAMEHGLIYGTLLEHDTGKANATPQNYNFNWVISGNNIHENMYIRYDASGNDNDTWYKNSITVTLRVFHAPTFTTDISVSDVFT